MASTNRQERLQMRQRGAATRKINNVDFGFSFDPTPGRRSARNTPQTAQNALRRPSITPSRRARQGSLPRSIRGSSGGPSSNRPARRDIYDVPSDDHAEGNVSASKRRKISEDTYQTNPRISVTPQQLLKIRERLGEQTARRRVSSNTLIQIAEDPEPDPSPAQLEGQEVEVPRNEARALLDDLESNKENVAVGGKKSSEPAHNNKANSAKKRKKRTSIGQQSGRSKKRSSTGSNTSETAARPESSAQAMTQIQSPDNSQGQAETASLPKDIDDPAPMDEPVAENVLPDATNTEPPQPVPTTQKKRRKRKSIAQTRKSRTSTESKARRTSTASAEGDQPQNASRVPSTAPNLYPSSIEVTIKTLAPRSRKNAQKTSLREKSGRRKAPIDSADANRFIEQEAANDSGIVYEPDTVAAEEETPRQHHNEPETPWQLNMYDSEGEDSTFLEPEPTPATVRSKPKKQQQRAARSPKRRVKHRRRSSVDPQHQRKAPAGTVPILTHRLANTAYLPTIVEEEPSGSDSEDDLHNYNHSHGLRFGTNRAAPNAIDVLAQICRETITNTLEKIEKAPRSDTGTNAEAKRKLTTMTAFGHSLDTRLFDMSAALEHRLTLEARLKRSKRDKAELQSRWIAVRREREAVALRCDALRRRHWENEAEGRQSTELSEVLHTLEMEVERAAEPVDGLEFKIRTLVPEVCGTAETETETGGGGGLLQRVRDFNRVLERTAMVLEAKDETGIDL